MMIDLNRLTDMSKNEVEASIKKAMDKVVTEEEFREYFSNYPKAALEKIGMKFKKDVEVKFVTNQKALASLPKNVFPLLIEIPSANKQLSTEQLQLVVGGNAAFNFIAHTRIGTFVRHIIGNSLALTEKIFDGLNRSHK